MGDFFIEGLYYLVCFYIVLGRISGGRCFLGYYFDVI